MDFVNIEPLDLPDEPVLLYPEQRVVRGRKPAPADALPLEGRVSLGRPLAIPLTPEAAGDDASLRSFIETEAGAARYALVYLACTFKPANGERIARAWLSVDLDATPAPSDGTPAVAWSMEPMRAAKELSRHRTLSLKVPVKFVEADAEVGTEVSVEQPFCEALGLQEPTPSWEFTDSETQRLRGSHRMHLVVRAPLTEVTGTMSLRATVTHKHFGLLTYHAGPALTFVI